MKSLLYTLLLVVAAMLTMGASCEERLIQIPVVGYVEQDFTVNSSNGSFESTETINFTDEINSLQEENAFENIVAISLESVSYTILSNSSAAGTEINGLAEVSTISFNNLVTLAELTDLNIAAIVGDEQVPTLETAGVSEINQAIDINAGNNQIFFSINGTTTPVPPPNLDFVIRVKVSFTIVGEIPTEVPVI